MNPEALAAALLLETRGLITPATARHLTRVAQGELISLRPELRLLVYGGVLVAMAGVGLLVQEHFSRIGPLAVTATLTLAAAATLMWVRRHAVPFSWASAESPHPAFDYMVVFAVLLAGADLAYVEATFTPLGAAWPWHLLPVSLLAGLAAFRYDSRVVFSLALSTFAAWRGVSVALLERSLWRWGAEQTTLQVNAIACGVLFLVLGAVLEHRRLKAHFEPVAVYLGWLLVLGALASRGDEGGGLVAAVLFLTGGGLAVLSLMQRRFWLFAMGLLGAYVALTRLALHGAGGEAYLYWFFFTSVALVGVLLFVHFRLKEPA